MVFAKISWFVNIKIDETGASRFAESFFRTEIHQKGRLSLPSRLFMTKNEWIVTPLDLLESIFGPKNEKFWYLYKKLRKSRSILNPWRFSSHFGILEHFWKKIEKVENRAKKF